jgi:hypothetical protein
MHTASAESHPDWLHRFAACTKPLKAFIHHPAKKSKLKLNLTLRILRKLQTSGRSAAFIKMIQ